MAHPSWSVLPCLYLPRESCAMPDDMERLGMRVAFFRQTRRPSLSQTDLAAAVGLTQPDISKLEHGRVRSITLRRLRLLATALGVRIGDLTDADPALDALPCVASEARLRLLRTLAPCSEALVDCIATLVEGLTGLPPEAWLAPGSLEGDDRHVADASASD